VVLLLKGNLLIIYNNKLIVAVYSYKEINIVVRFLIARKILTAQLIIYRNHHYRNSRRRKRRRRKKRKSKRIRIILLINKLKLNRNKCFSIRIWGLLLKIAIVEVVVLILLIIIIIII
jgi:hypothetical protein